MLPSSRQIRKNNPETLQPISLDGIERFYRKTKSTIDVTDARDNSKIRNKYKNTILDEKFNNVDDDDHDDHDDVDDRVNEITPSYLESSISNKLSLYDMEQEEDYESKFDNGLSIKKHKLTNVKYPFSDKSSKHLTHDLDNIYENLYKINGEDGEDGEIVVEFLVYYINHSAYKPFLEFMLYKSDEDDTFYFPNFSQNSSKYDILDNASILLDSLFSEGLCKFKGRIIESSNMNDVKSAQINQRIILLYELTEKNDTIHQLRHSDAIWWGTVSEIFNHKKILFYNINDSVTDVFLAYPAAIKIYHKESLIETPMVVYNGSDSNNAKYNAVFSIKKANNESRYGPFYYFTDLYNAMRYACYDVDGGEKNAKGGLVRFVIHPGKMKMFLKKDKPDRSEMAKYISSTNAFEKKTAQFRDNDCKWIEDYNSSYNGIQEIPIKKSDSNRKKKGEGEGEGENEMSNIIYMNDSDNDDIVDTLYEGGAQKNIQYLAMRICISEYTFQTPLSYYYIDTKDIPNNYEYDFKKYKII